MTLSDLANIAEILGGIAVVASLVYLAVQIRQNTSTVRNSTLQSNTALWTSVFCNLAEPSIAEAYAAGLSGKADIKPLHYTQFFLLCRGMFVAFENQYYQFCQGTLDRETYEGYERTISSQILVFPGFRIWWKQCRDVFSPVFVEHIDAMISDVPEGSADMLFSEYQSIARDKASTT